MLWRAVVCCGVLWCAEQVSSKETHVARRAGLQHRAGGPVCIRLEPAMWRAAKPRYASGCQRRARCADFSQSLPVSLPAPVACRQLVTDMQDVARMHEMLAVMSVASVTAPPAPAPLPQPAGAALPLPGGAMLPLPPAHAAGAPLLSPVQAAVLAPVMPMRAAAAPVPLPAPVPPMAAAVLLRSCCSAARGRAGVQPCACWFLPLAAVPDAPGSPHPLPAAQLRPGCQFPGAELPVYPQLPPEDWPAHWLILFVAGLPHDTTNRSLVALFQQRFPSAAAARLLPLPHDPSLAFGRPSRRGFVAFERREERDAAVQEVGIGVRVLSGWQRFTS